MRNTIIGKHGFALGLFLLCAQVGKFDIIEKTGQKMPPSVSLYLNLVAKAPTYLKGCLAMKCEHKTFYNRLKVLGHIIVGGG